MKKKKHFFLIIAVSILLSACSFLGEVNDSIDYVNQATDHINKLNTFAEEAPQLIQSAATDLAVQKELEIKLVNLKQDIETFININDVPSIAKDIHQELVVKNEQLLDEINQVLQNGHLVLDKLENSQIFATLNEVTNLLNRIENLGQ
ncbi:PBP1b-binding outer membrane lipoprotein LpoB [Bacillus sp. SORGH_AS 510]|uniref:DUF6376 family protein n=1 Tax=Bacillus sp. SORGH_AS_0510 TaxID=3041771 RepID=UPI00278583CA|nr:DUF6376 family protein [Bacillus sp. SORGH_AS_0510]MDQ1144097.1 PBP1b-binding outer membrane lipoprotein LpoB [Bacillus sp. SORGH_AS_0510]